MGADGGVCRLLYDVHQTLSLGPCAATVQRAPSHNRWGVSETTLLRRHKGGRWTVRLISRHQVLQGGFNVSLPSVQQGCGGSGGHGSATGGALTPPRVERSLRGGRALNVASLSWSERSQLV